jgi:hypothetical protein
MQLGITPQGPVPTTLMPRSLCPERQIFLALNSNSCHNIIKLEQKFIVPDVRKADWCNCFTALKAFQVIQDLPLPPLLR